MSKSKSLLQKIIPNWSEESPSTLIELFNADYNTLSETEKELRALAVELVQLQERTPISTASVAKDLLERKHLTSRNGYWTFIALNEKKDRYYIRWKDGYRLVNYQSKTLPDIETLRKNAPLPENGSYILIFGGSPEILNQEKELNSWKKIVSEFTLSDLIIWENSENGNIFWSLGAGVGQIGNKVIGFRDNINYQDWRNCE